MRIFAWLAAVAAVLASTLGLLVIVWPYWELANHFRPFVLLTCLGLAALAWWVGVRPVFKLALGLILFNALLLLPGLLDRAAFAKSSAGSVRELKLMSFNIWIGNRQIDAVVEEIKKQNADIVVLQEVTAWQYERLLPRLDRLYPFRASCAQNNSCLLAVFSRRRLSDVNILSRAFGRPPLIDVLVENRAGERAAGERGKGRGRGRFRLLVTHIAWPFHPNRQRVHMNWLANYVGPIKAPLVVAGDFNLSPWSWKLARFQWASGLRRHTTFMLSWPANRYRPFVQLDHVLSSPDIKALAAKTAGRAGSDHLPVVATLQLPQGT